MTIEEQARTQWAALMGGGGAQDRSSGAPVAADLPAPTGVTAVQGRGHVTIAWDPVAGAIGYAIHRAETPSGPFTVVDHGGGDVLAVPHGPYADTTTGRGGWYAVAALQTVNAIGPLSEPVSAHPAQDVEGTALGTRHLNAAAPPPPEAARHTDPGVGPRVDPGIGPRVDPGVGPAVDPGIGARVDPGVGPHADPDVEVAALGSRHAPSGPRRTPAPRSAGTPAVIVTVGGPGSPLHRVWQEVVGSEHLSHLLESGTTGGRPIGAELREALRRVHDDLGVRSVRAHHILGDDLGVCGESGYDFSRVDEVYDIVRDLGMVPVVELGYMPAALAADPSRTVFAYQGIISPPADWSRWADLVRAFTAHLADRYGLAELRERWRFEVWNEPNLSVFWSGTPAEYWRLYTEAARAVKSVDPGLQVGGPATAAVGWIDDQLRVDAPVDFLSTHVYGTVPLDLRPWADGRPILWTEWGVTATHGSRINDSVFAAAFLLRGMHSAAGRMQALAPWVASDHFEELGRPQRLFHGGFGLLTVGNLAKPKFWALWLAQRLGDVQLPVTLTGDGADSLVQAWASRYPDGGVGVLLWNSTLDHSRADDPTRPGDPSAANRTRPGDPTAGDPIGTGRPPAGELDRRVHLDPGLTGPHTVRLWRVDTGHGNIAAHWTGGDWPTAEQWAVLKEADVLPEAEPSRRLEPGEEVVLDLPNPGIAFLEIRPE
ncbi:GH39 family glycosyl hydrolase [Paractinoplanes toevensis]|uniref:Glycosyl hydrolases family 39 N-terminal catalytic domain-containing protein n=1 Tax=Paractinoplanes toevensis TaxID=571911 RepID=A0A919TIA6_9ACTN|nr:xylan 1,4-beta-xylosidase [Actinoplanes toevensis]GIM94870.1 hypothetical protein Ato02nite_066630 [Actinoplanes toevensis]